MHSSLFTVAAVLVASLATPSICGAAVPFDGPAPFRPWANYLCEDPSCEPSRYRIGAENRTQTGGGDFTNASRRWSEGAFPRVLSDGRVINGGIPQRGNLSYHLERLREGIDAWLPDADWALHAVIDFEAWTPVWESNNGGSCDWHGMVYRELSVNYTRQRFPNITNGTAIEALAQAEFEAAAIEFFVETMVLLKRLRPKAQWGFYGFPYAVNGECERGSLGDDHCGYENPTTGPTWRARNDKLARVWRAVDALYPSVYLLPQGDRHFEIWQRELWTRTRNAVRESIRISTKFSPSAPVPVLPFYWPMYHNDTTPIGPHNLKQLIAEVYAPPLATQLIIWNGFPVDVEAFRTVDGPVFKEAVAMADACTTATCSGHGWCDASIAFPGWGPQPTPGANCTCYPGFSGNDCATL